MYETVSPSHGSSSSFTIEWNDNTNFTSSKAKDTCAYLHLPQISYWVLTYILPRYGFGIIFYPSFDFWHRPLNLPSFRIGHPSNTRRMLSHILWLDEMDSRNSIGRRDSLNNYLMGGLYLVPICAKRQQLLPTQHILQHPRSSAK